MADQNVTFNISTNKICKSANGKFSSPEEIANFSVDSKGQVHCDDREKRYILSTSDLHHLHLKMTEDFTSNIPKYANADRRLNFFLKWLLLNFDTISRYPNDRVFICHRGLLISLSKCIYTKEDFLICASKFKGIIYMAAFDTEDYKKFHSFSEPFGKFFEYAFTEGRGNEKSQVCEMGKYEVVFRRKMKDSTLLYCAEIDAADKGNAEKKIRYVEMKTMLDKRIKKGMPRVGMLSQWTQNHWAGITRLVYGLHNGRDKVITDTKVVLTEKVLEMSKVSWQDPKLDVRVDSFCEKFLAHVQNIVVKDDPNVVYKFSHNKNSSYIITEEVKNPKEHRVLPEWYVKKIEEM